MAVTPESPVPGAPTQGAAQGREALPAGREAWPTDRVAGGVLCVTAGLLTWQSLRLPLGSLHDPGAGYLPLVLALLMGTLGLVLLAWPGRTVRMDTVVWPEARHALAILGVCGASAVLLERMGWRITSFLLMAFLIGVVERQRWWVTLLLALGMSLGSFHLFATLLKVPLPVEPFPW